ncbi:MAG: bifunctional precorrin-2 dehydrogenase/sirohydrochlorin ferrochelatase [Myxococcales bacterium]|nr:bifunctional precorrin-2 dehydrogenase/sirohydrochlorin ferrochelatase [Myxococcales bacterium]
MRRQAFGLQVSLDVEGKRALVLGGGDEGADKVQRLLDARATVTVISRAAGGAIEVLAERSKLVLLQRDLFPADIRDADLVLVCDRDPALVATAFEVARSEGAAIWCCDDPEHSDFALPALCRAGRTRVAISTSGAAPALAARLRAALERDLDAKFRAFVDRLGAERERLLTEEPDPDRRREQLRALVDGFEATLTLRYPGE